MIERRNVRRRRLVQQLSIYDRATDRFLGRSADLTVKGLLMITDQPIAIGANLAMRIHLPQSLFGTDHIDVDGKAVWCKRDANPGCFDVGFDFTSLPLHGQEIIGELIATYGLVG